MESCALLVFGIRELLTNLKKEREPVNFHLERICIEPS